MELSCLGLYTPGRVTHGKQVLGERPNKNTLLRGKHLDQVSPCLDAGHWRPILETGLSVGLAGHCLVARPMGPRQAHPKNIAWVPLLMGSSPVRRVKGVGCRVSWAAALAVQSLAKEISSRDLECHLSIREGTQASVHSREIPNSSPPHTLGLWYQFSHERLDILLLWICQTGGDTYCSPIIGVYLSGDSIVLQGDFNAHVGTYNET